jgi:alanine racemase
MLSWEQSPIALMQRERAWVEVNLAAIAHNVGQLRQHLNPTADLMAVVKADAYGHGATLVTETILKAGATWLGVATIPEGIDLRESGIDAPILVLGATNTAQQVQTLVHWDLQPTLCTAEQAHLFARTVTELAKTDARARRKLPLSVHVKLDTGMSRLGAPWESGADLVELVGSLPQLTLASVYSHLATADEPDRRVMDLQHRRFQQAQAAILKTGVPVPRWHLVNSAGLLVDSTLHYDMARAGLAVYGIAPAPHLADILDLQPALQVKARITQIKSIEAGTGVSYGHRFVAPTAMRMAVVGIGYADGVPRNLSTKLEVLVQGQRVQQLGSITMDQIMIDVSAIPDLKEGDVVTLLGQDGQEQIRAEEWANHLGTIPWEILTGFKLRLPRIAIHTQKPPLLKGHPSSLIPASLSA